MDAKSAKTLTDANANNDIRACKSLADFNYLDQCTAWIRPPKKRQRCPPEKTLYRRVIDPGNPGLFR
jgi:hypothetical protein